MITAIVLVETDVAPHPRGGHSRSPSSTGVSEVYSVTGDVDLVAMVRVHEHEELADVIADQLNKIDGVRSTKTYLAFRAYSRHDLDAAFALGFDGD